MLHNDQWGSICPKGWDDNAANVVCRELGHRFGLALYLGHGGTAPPSAPVWIKQIHCNGSENHLWQCEYSDLQMIHTCSNGRDPGALCSNDSVETNGGKKIITSACTFTV